MKRFIAMAALCAGLMVVQSPLAHAQYPYHGGYHHHFSNPDSSTTPTITITPSSLTLTDGETQQFTASVTNSDAGTSWSTTDASGSVSSSGLYTAGFTPGTYTITATSFGVSASATVTVTAPGSTGSGGSGSSGSASGSSSGASGGTGAVIFQDNFNNLDNWYPITARTPSVVSCSGGSLPNCAQISVDTGDSGNNLLDLCTIGSVAGCNDTNLTLPSSFYIKVLIAVSPGANFGATSQNAKFAYFKNVNGGNVAYYDAAVSAENPLAVQLRAIADQPSLEEYNYVNVSTVSGFHVAEAYYQSGGLFEMWWDGQMIGTYPPASAGSLPVQNMTDTEWGIYLNGTAGSSFTIQLNDFEICTGGRCP